MYPFLFCPIGKDKPFSVLVLRTLTPMLLPPCLSLFRPSFLAEKQLSAGHEKNANHAVLVLSLFLTKKKALTKAFALF